ncbi:flavin-containing monooxygenase [Pseudonocardia oceani]|uniref:flavin-containing monooxygenase n=1 Tax=Pseudonocardia oceani TaxID=2792013 RepID=UPI001C49E0A0|nr:NAD(P)/FAD-dependent oxidoreductase [Pseudonocardia oceani]
MTSSVPEQQTPETWLERFGAALGTGDVERVRAFLAPELLWRDLLVTSWDFRNRTGQEVVAALAGPELGVLEPTGLRLVHDAVHQQVGDVTHVLVFFAFDTSKGRCTGFVRLVPGGTEGWVAGALLTQLDELAGHPERRGALRPIGKARGARRGRPGWAEERARQREFLDADPDVVVVGAGHSGLSLAARLGRLGVSTLVVERNDRVGDNWRKRYPSLFLHDVAGMDHLPYLPLPDTWQRYTPKDKFAAYLEFYETALDLDVWTSSSVTAAVFDPVESRWTVTMRRRDGSDRTVRPRHLVIATGFNGEPRTPHLPGSDEFGGALVHAGAFEGGAPWRGKRAVVLGAGVSGHDVAQDLYEQGADVVMVQRSTSYVIDLSTYEALYTTNYEDGSGVPTDMADMAAWSVPWGRIPELGKMVAKAAAEIDAALLDGLAARGFGLDLGPDGSGHYGKHILDRRDGYYLNIGASELIADGRVEVRQGRTITGLTGDGVLLSDGELLPADLVVLATGYGSLEDAARQIVGDEIVDRCAPVYRLGEDLEMSAVWRRTAQEGLWFMTGSVQMARFYSKILALQIKGAEVGANPADGER